MKLTPRLIVFRCTYRYRRAKYWFIRHNPDIKRRYQAKVNHYPYIRLKGKISKDQRVLVQKLDKELFRLYSTNYQCKKDWWWGL